MTTRLETLKGLDQVANVATPIPAAVANFYSQTLAQGTGPNGTFLITDLLPGASGIRENAAITSALTLINSSATANLGTLYAQMVSVVDSTYGTPPTVIIPTGPAANTYISYDDALQALFVAADAEIGNIVTNTTVTNQVTTANQDWTAMARAWVLAPAARANASINLASLPTTAQLPVTAFIASLDQQGTDTEVGMGAQYLQSVADTTTQAGQALVGALRQSRNNAALNAVGVGHDNQVPDQPTTPPPQANLGNANYSVSEARVYVTDNLSS
jgi:hypothetical protein